MSELGQRSQLQNAVGKIAMISRLNAQNTKVTPVNNDIQPFNQDEQLPPVASNIARSSNVPLERKGTLNNFRKNAQIGIISNLSTIKSLVKEKSDELNNYKNIIYVVFVVFTLYIIVFVNWPGWFFTDANGNSITKNDMPYWDKVTNGTYFTTTCMSTIGYGDITPKTNTAKLVVSVTNMVALLISIGVISLVSNDVVKNLNISKLIDTFKK